MERRLPDVAEAVPVTRRHNHGLSNGQCGALLANSNLRLASKHGQNLLYSVQMSGRTAIRLAPLLEDAQLNRAGQGRGTHSREHAGSPLFLLLSRMIDDAHGTPVGSSVERLPIAQQLRCTYAVP